jgi:hypothetical protein
MQGFAQKLGLSQIKKDRENLIFLNGIYRQRNNEDNPLLSFRL